MYGVYGDLVQIFSFFIVLSFVLLFLMVLYIFIKIRALADLKNENKRILDSLKKIRARLGMPPSPEPVRPVIGAEDNKK